MMPIDRIHPLRILLTAYLAVAVVGWGQPARARDREGGEKSDGVMTLLKSPHTANQVLLLAWRRPAPIPSAILADTSFEGVCCHCNLPMKFKAGEAAAHCSICPCNAVYTACLIGKETGKNGWSEMLDALPQGVGLHVEFVDPQKPSAGIKRMAMDLRAVLLPLEKPLEITDAQLLGLLKALGVRSVERADGDKLLRLTLKEDWSKDRADRLQKIFAQQGIVLKFSPEVVEKS